MKIYELTYLISPDLPEKETGDLLQEINNLILQEGGKISQESRPTKQRLSYPIKKRVEAFLATLSFSLEPGKLEKLEKLVKDKNQIIRYILLVKQPPERIRRRISLRRPERIPSLAVSGETLPQKSEKEKKAELKEIDQKIEEILKE